MARVVVPQDVLGDAGGGAGSVRWSRLGRSGAGRGPGCLGGCGARGADAAGLNLIYKLISQVGTF